MSSKVAFQVHYGDFYKITHDSYGVNLSALERRQCSLSACSVSGLDAASYVSQYFTKKAAAQTWCHEIYGMPEF